MPFSELPTAAQVALVALAVLQLALQVTALVILLRAPAERLTQPRWAWVLIVVLGSLAGAVVFLVAGRRPAAADAPEGATSPEDDAHRGETIGRAVDILYRDRS